MARKKKGPEKPASKAYIISFSDTMTTMLAFFIVLVSLADEQSGANLHAGTGSFMRALNSAGMPGMLPGDNSKLSTQFEAIKPQYIVDDPENREHDNQAIGPDQNDNNIPVVDREKEELQRFVTEMQRSSKTESLPKVRGELSFDFFNKLSPVPPFLPEGFDAVLAQVYPLLKQNGYRVEVIVWATTPSDSAWTRATQQGASIVSAIISRGSLSKSESKRLHSYGSPWMYSDVKRPTFSIVIRRVETE